MTTTAVFAEILSVGLQALVWVALAVLVLGGAEVFDGLPWETIGDFAALLSVAALALAYTLGVLVDRVADTLLSKLRDYLPEKKTKKGRRDSVAVMRLRVRYKGGGDISTFLDYVRSRVRITRSTALNAALATIFGVLAVEGAANKAIVAACGLVLLVASVYAWWHISATYRERLKQAHAIVKGTRQRK